MKKQILASLCLAVLLVAMLIPIASGTDDEPTVYHLVINDHFFDRKELDSNTMPVSLGGIIYVPYTVFDKDVAGADFKISYGLKREDGAYLLFLYSMDGTLVFDLNQGTAADGQGNPVNMHAIFHNGLPFIPIQGVCNYFEELAGGIKLVQYVYTPIKHYGVLIRLRNNEAGLDDSRFLSSAMSALQARYNRYIQTLTTSATPSATSNGGIPAVVTPTPAPTAPVDNSAENKEDVPVYLAFQCGEGNGLEAILGRLKQSGIYALFLFRPEDLSANDTLIRRIVGEGHTLGLIVPGTSVAEAESAVAEGNALLERIAWTRTRVILPEGADQQVIDSLSAGNSLGEHRASGWHCWQGNVSGLGNGSVTGITSQVMAAVEKRSVARVTLDDTIICASALPRILSQLQEDKYDIQPVLETGIS